MLMTYIFVHAHIILLLVLIHDMLPDYLEKGCHIHLTFSPEREKEKERGQEDKRERENEGHLILSDSIGQGGRLSCGHSRNMLFTNRTSHPPCVVIYTVRRACL